jgi:tetratricopeptide (TPR) repeat protein
VLDSRERHGAADLHRRSLAWNNLGLVAQTRGDMQGAEAAYRKALELARSDPRASPANVATALCNLGQLLAKSGDLDAAGAALREGVDLRRRAFGDRHQLVAQALNLLSLVYVQLGRFDEADSVLSESIAILDPIISKGEADEDLHIEWVQEQDALGNVRLGELDPRGAAECFERALAGYRRIYGDDHAYVAGELRSLARTAEYQDDAGLVETYLQAALCTFRGVGGADCMRTAQESARCAIDAGRLDQASVLLDECEELRRSARLERHKIVGEYATVRAELALARGEPWTAQEHACEGLEILEDTLPGDHPWVLFARGVSAVAQLAARPSAQAQNAANEAFEALRRRLGESHRATSWVASWSRRLAAARDGETVAR